MATAERPYFFANHEDVAEARRLQQIERDADRYSQFWLDRLGIGPGARALEAGVGAGSMARWMAERAGAEGHVIGVDMSDRFFPLTIDSPVELITSDIRDVTIAEASLDFVHARLFLMHLPDRAEVLTRMASWLKPGGWAVLAESDFSFGCRGTGDWHGKMAAANDGFVAAVRNLGGDAETGAKLPALLAGAGFVNVQAEGVFPFITPGSDKHQILSSSLDVMQRLGVTDHLSDGDYDELRRLLPGGTVVQTSYVLVVAAGQKPA